MERNKDPIKLLNSVTILLVCGSVTTIIMFTFGTKFDPFQCAVSIPQLIFSILFPILMLKKSIANGLNLNKKDFVCIGFLISSESALILYGCAKATPFGSLPLFFLGVFVQTFFYMTASQCITLSNKANVNDPNYQIKFFVKRIMLGIINCTGFVDVLSDIALGYEIINKYGGYLQGLAISMFILCLLDFVIVNIRLFNPLKVTIHMHAWAIVLETIILTVSVLAGVRISRDSNMDWDFILLLVFSFVSTVINFLHHIFIIVQWHVRRLARKDVTFVEVLE